MKRTDVTYGQLDKVLRSLGFACRLVEKEPPTRVYEHKESGALLMMPAFPETDYVLAYHLVAAQGTLEYSGIADAKEFDARLQNSTPTVAISETAYRILKELAERTAQPMVEVLDKALDAYRRKVFFEQLNAGYAALRADPAAWAEVEKERRSMDGCLMDGLDPHECWSEGGEPIPPPSRLE